MRLISSMKPISFFILWPIYILLFNAVGLVHSAEINISIAVHETLDPRLLDAAVNVQMGATDQTLQRNQFGKFPFKSNVSIRDNPILKIQITPTTNYRPREILFPTSTVLANNNTSYDFYLAKNSPSLTYEYLDNGVRFHAKEFDKAFAYYDVAYANRERKNMIRQFDIKLDYNYAVSVANTCLRLGYATCDDARDLYKKLKEDSISHRNWFDKEKINLAELDKTLNDLSIANINVQYKTFKTLFDKKKYLDSVEIATDLLDKFNSDESGFSGARITKDRLLEDIGAAYVQASLVSSPDNKSDDAKDFLQKAHRYYSEISVKSSQVTRDINYINQIK